MALSLESHANTLGKPYRKSADWSGLEAGSPKEYFVNSRNSSGRGRVQPNLPRIVLEDMKDASHSPAEAGVVWHEFYFSDSDSMVFSIPVLRGDPVEAINSASDDIGPELVKCLIEAEKSGRDKALDQLYDAVDDMYRDGRVDELNAILSAIPVQQLSVHLLLGFLTATLPFRSQLPARLELRSRVEETLRQRGEYHDSLLSGL
jgi:hypothetical protein